MTPDTAEADPGLADPAVADPSFARDVGQGLTRDPKSIPPRWLYDERGSELFEAITELDEYYLTRTERAVLSDHAEAMVQGTGSPLEIIELGAGSAAKTRLLLQAAIDRNGQTTYCPVDISPKAIDMAVEQLREHFSEDELTIRPVIGPYGAGLEKLKEARTVPRLVLFIGSSIGNFPEADQVALLSQVAQAMAPEDRFLLGTDLAKPAEILEPAYDDDQGVTAAFTKNLLHRMNRELGATFDLDAFEHTATYRPERHRVEIHLESLGDQTVTVEALDLEVAFEQGELLHTEHSYKYTEALLSDLLDRSGLTREHTWTDEKGWFALHLLAPGGAGR